MQRLLPATHILNLSYVSVLLLPLSLKHTHTLSLLNTHISFRCKHIHTPPHTHTHTHTNRHTAHKQTNTNSQGIARQLESTDQQDYISSERPAKAGNKAGSLVIDKEGVLM